MRNAEQKQLCEMKKKSGISLAGIFCHQHEMRGSISR